MFQIVGLPNGKYRLVVAGEASAQRTPSLSCETNVEGKSSWLQQLSQWASTIVATSM
jgi:hypothetical protein